MRFAPGSRPVPPAQQIPDIPSDSAEWMNIEPEEYEGGPLFGEEPDADH